MMARLRHAIDDATAALTEAGVGSPRADAEELAAYAAGTSRGRLALLDHVGDDFFGRYRDLVAARSKRVPLQYLTGTAVFGQVVVHVGPGVFTPRPETEAMLEWAMSQHLPATPLIVDLCTGSGALAAALAHHAPRARIVAVDNSSEALEFARRNTVGSPVELRLGDVLNADLFPDLDRTVDLIVANPPYLPDGVALEPEVAQHDPPRALFGGPDGTTVIAAICKLAERWLRAGGMFAVEHDDEASAAVTGLLCSRGSFTDIASHTDFANRPRFVTARRKSAS
jgi:release factor glutamine methyltransferase